MASLNEILASLKGKSHERDNGCRDARGTREIPSTDALKSAKQLDASEEARVGRGSGKPRESIGLGFDLYVNLAEILISRKDAVERDRGREKEVKREIPGGLSGEFSESWDAMRASRT